MSTSFRRKHHNTTVDDFTVRDCLLIKKPKLSTGVSALFYVDNVSTTTYPSLVFPNKKNASITSIIVTTKRTTPMTSKLPETDLAYFLIMEW